MPSKDESLGGWETLLDELARRQLVLLSVGKKYVETAIMDKRLVRDKLNMSDCKGN
jgi:hypothetical protein